MPWGVPEGVAREGADEDRARGRSMLAAGLTAMHVRAAKTMVAEDRPFPPARPSRWTRLGRGTYAVYYSIPRHREAEMQATLRDVP